MVMSLLSVSMVLSGPADLCSRWIASDLADATLAVQVRSPHVWQRKHTNDEQSATVDVYCILRSASKMPARLAYGSKSRPDHSRMVRSSHYGRKTRLLGWELGSTLREKRQYASRSTVDELAAKIDLVCMIVSSKQ